MSLCRIMVEDFINPLEKEERYYDNYDLESGVAFSEWLIEEGFELEPFYGYNLEDFIIWAKNKLKRKEK